MGDGLLSRVKGFIGLEEEGLEGGATPQQMDMSTLLRGKKDGNRAEAGFGSQIMFYEPKVYEDSLNISTHLRGGSPVIISLKHLDPAEGTRLIDFVCGAAYAIDGHMMKIGESIFLFTPASIMITAAEERAPLTDELNSEHSRRETFF